MEARRFNYRILVDAVSACLINVSKVGFFVFSLATLASCSSEKSNLQYVIQNDWLYESGYKAGEGDLIEFSGMLYTLKSDTIFRNHVPVALVYSVNPNDYKMVIKSMNEGQLGIYYNTGYYFEKD